MSLFLRRFWKRCFSSIFQLECKYAVCNMPAAGRLSLCCGATSCAIKQVRTTICTCLNCIRSAPTGQHRVGTMEGPKNGLIWVHLFAISGILAHYFIFCSTTWTDIKKFTPKLQTWLCSKNLQNSSERFMKLHSQRAEGTIDRDY